MSEAGARSRAVASPLTLVEKLAYGLGEVGEAVKTAALETFLFFYYIQVIGLPGAMTGLALFIALLVDAIADPLIGHWSDRTRSPLGRRHPFLYAAPIPLAIGIVLLFSPPATLPQWGIFLWLTGFTIIARVAMAMYFVPHMALGADLSNDYDERIQVGAYRTGFSYLGRLLALGAGFSIFFVATAAFPVGQLNPAAYLPFALFCAAVVIVVVFVSAWGTQARARGLAAQRVDYGEAPPWRVLAQAIRVRSFRAMFLSLLVLYIFNGTQAALMLHMATYYWELGAGATQATFYGATFGAIAGVYLVRPFARRFDKKRAYIVGVLLACFSASMPVLLRLAGVFPANGDPLLVPLLVAFNVGFGLFGTVPVTLSAAMLADVADAYEHRFRERSEGFFFGAVAFSRKASLGLGGAGAGLVLALIAFPTSGAKVGGIAPDVLTRLAVLYGPTMLAILCMGLLILLPYDLSRRRHAEIMRDLEQR